MTSLKLWLLLLSTATCAAACAPRNDDLHQDWEHFDYDRITKPPVKK